MRLRYFLHFFYFKFYSPQKTLESVINYAKYFLEHPGDLFISSQNSMSQRQLFTVIFEEPPTYEDFKFGTAKLMPILAISRQEKITKFQLVDQLAKNWNQIISDLENIQYLLDTLLPKEVKISG